MPKGIYKRKAGDIRNSAKAALLGSDDPVVRAKARWKGIKPWLGIFLEHWRTSQDRTAALKESGTKTIADLDEALEKYPRFAAAYEEVQREIIVALEDAQVAAAMSGKNSGAQKLALEAFSSRYQKKPNAAKRGASTRSPSRVSGVRDFSAAASKTWGSIFDSTRSTPTAEGISSVSPANP